MKYLLKLNNGIILILIGIMHSQFALSAEGFKKQFQTFGQSNFYSINKGLDDLAVKTSFTYESMAAFWFLYFGLLVIALGVFVFSIERKNNHLPQSFIIAYFVVILIGVYMIPNSGMTIFMLPHAVIMLVINFIRIRNSKNRISEDFETTN